MGYSNDQRPLQEGVNLKHVVLMILLLGLLLFRPLVPSVVVDAVFLPTMIVSAWLAGGRTRSSLIVTVVSSLGAFGVLLFDLLAHEQFNTFFHQPLGFPVAVAILVLFLYCAVVILRSLLTTERVFVNEIIGTFNLYLIMGYIWSYVYLLLELTSPGSFESASKAGNLGLRFIYFSFVTITTVGFGDTVPASPMAQMLVVLEAIIGQFYVAVVVAYLVSMFIIHELASRNKDD
jgi:hypothetical protein